MEHGLVYSLLYTVTIRVMQRDWLVISYFDGVRANPKDFIVTQQTQVFLRSVNQKQNKHEVTLWSKSQYKDLCCMTTKNMMPGD